MKKAHAGAPLRVSAVTGQAEARGIAVGDVVLNIDQHQIMSSTSVEDAQKILFEMGMNPIEIVLDRADLKAGRPKRASVASAI